MKEVLKRKRRVDGEREVKEECEEGFQGELKVNKSLGKKSRRSKRSKKSDRSKR